MAVKLIVLSGPSGAGKNTLINHVLENFPHKIKKVITATTRPPRPGEYHGIDKYFLTLEEFQRKIKNGDFIEYEEVLPGTWYGTLKLEIERILSSNEIGIMDLDVHGALDLKSAYPKEVYLVFVRTSTLEVLKDRLHGRLNEGETTIEDRLGRSVYEISKEKEYDVTVINDELAIAFKEIENIIKTLI